MNESEVELMTLNKSNRIDQIIAVKHDTRAHTNTQ